MLDCMSYVGRKICWVNDFDFILFVSLSLFFVSASQRSFNVSECLMHIPECEADLHAE